MFKEFWKILKRFASPYKGYLVGSVVLNLLSAVFNLFSFALIMPILAELMQDAVEADADAELLDEEADLNLERMEKKAIEEALRRNRNRRKLAAVDLGISERTLYRKIKDYGLEE